MVSYVRKDLIIRRRFRGVYTRIYRGRMPLTRACVVLAYNATFAYHHDVDSVAGLPRLDIVGSWYTRYDNYL